MRPDSPIMATSQTLRNYELRANRADSERDEVLSKVPAVTLAFWIIKILATTLGETGGDAVSMSMNLGYAVGTGIFFTIFLITMVAQVTTKSFHPFLYWAVIVATTTPGTTRARFAVRF